MTIHQLTPAYGFLLSTNSEILRFLKIVLSEKNYNYTKEAFEARSQSDYEDNPKKEDYDSFLYEFNFPNTTKKIPGLTWCYLTHDLEENIERYEKDNENKEYDCTFFVGFNIKNQFEKEPSYYRYSTCMFLKFEDVCKAKDNTEKFAKEHNFELRSSDIYFLQNDCGCCS